MLRIKELAFIVELIQVMASAWHPNIIPRHEQRLLRHGSAFGMSQGVARASPAFPDPWLCWAADQVGQLWW